MDTPATGLLWHAGLVITQTNGDRLLAATSQSLSLVTRYALLDFNVKNA